MPSIACSASIFTPPTMPPSKRRAACRKAGALLSSAQSMAIACRCREWRPMRSANRPCRGWRAAWRADFGPRGITVNVVQPGPIDTDANPENGPMKELMHSFMAIKRHGRPEEVAGMVAWLAGPESVVCHWRHAHHRRSVWRLIPQGGDARFAPPPRERHRLSGIIRPGYRPPHKKRSSVSISRASGDWCALRIIQPSSGARLR